MRARAQTFLRNRQNQNASWDIQRFRDCGISASKMSTRAEFFYLIFFFDFFFLMMPQGISMKKKTTNYGARETLFTAGSVPTPPQNESFGNTNSSRSKPQPLPCTGQVRSGQVRSGQVQVRYVVSICGLVQWPYAQFLGWESPLSWNITWVRQ